MKRIKILALTLALGLAGMMYAANSHAQSNTQDDADSCTGQSCCTGGSCCTTHKK